MPKDASRLGDIGAMLGALKTVAGAAPAENHASHRQRRMIADFCRLLGQQVMAETTVVARPSAQVAANRSTSLQFETSKDEGNRATDERVRRQGGDASAARPSSGYSETIAIKPTPKARAAATLDHASNDSAASTDLLNARPAEPAERAILQLNAGVNGRTISRRMAQTLERLLAGDSEKQIANHLKLSPNTVHVYVKSLYKHYNVNSRGELLARWVRVER